MVKLGDIEVDDQVYKDAVITAFEKVSEQRAREVEKMLGIKPEDRRSIKDFFSGKVLWESTKGVGWK